MKKNSYLVAVLCFVGAVILFLLSGRPDGQFDGLSRAEVGLSGALIGNGLVVLIRAWRASKRTPEQRREAELKETDERNVSIRKNAAYDSWYCTLVLLFVLWVICLIREEGLYTTLVTVVLILHCLLYLANIGRWVKKL